MTQGGGIPICHSFGGGSIQLKTQASPEVQPIRSPAPRRVFRVRVLPILLTCVSLRDDSECFIKSCSPHILQELFPMNHAIEDLQIVVRQIDLASPDPPMKV